MIRVEGHSNLYRDEKTGAVVNTDSMAYNQYVKSLEHRDSQKKELNEMKKRLAFVVGILCISIYIVVVII